MNEEEFDADELLRDMDEGEDMSEDEEGDPEEIDFNYRNYFGEIVGDVEDPQDLWD